MGDKYTRTVELIEDRLRRLLDEIDAAGVKQEKEELQRLNGDPEIVGILAAMTTLNESLKSRGLYAVRDERGKLEVQQLSAASPRNKASLKFKKFKEKIMDDVKSELLLDFNSTVTRYALAGLKERWEGFSGD